MSGKSRFWFRAALSCMYAIIFASTLMIIYTAGPWLETRFWPVVSKLTILQTEMTGPAQTKIWAYFTKMRACDYIGIAWYQIEGDDVIRVPLQLLREPGDLSSPNRPIGSTKAGPWIVDIPRDLVKSKSYVELQHRCHPFWVTTTEFYP